MGFDVRLRKRVSDQQEEKNTREDKTRDELAASWRRSTQHEIK
jgi:hypothetical protein